MNNEILINSETGREYINVPATVAAKYLDISLRLVYDGLQKKTLPIGSAIQSDKGRWVYNIPINRLKAYANGIDVLQATEIIKLINQRLIKEAT
ncbi:MAG: hypothetical protein J1E85_10595 [Ruminococcus sp.]|nr:hypothetical protein [Ruminococcus sp.]